MTENTWRDIRGYEGKYQCNYKGQIRHIYPSGKTREIQGYWKHKIFVCKLTLNGKSKEATISRVIAQTFLGDIPEKHFVVHKNGVRADNHVNNLVIMTRSEAGKYYGASARRRPVARLDKNGEIIDVYRSARQAAAKNYISRQAVVERCNGKVKKPGDYIFRWEDE